MNSFFALLSAIWQTLLTGWKQQSALSVAAITPSPSTPPATGVPIVADATATLQQKLEALIEHENGAMFSPVSGGTIHVIDAATRTQVASIIIASAHPTEGLTVSLLASWIKGESCFDPAAYNPNLSGGITHGFVKPGQMTADGETEAQAFLHTDWGIAQIDGKELAGYGDLAGMSWQDQKASALDPTWAIPAMVDTCLGLLAWAKGIHGSNAAPPWGSDYRVLAATAYNLGRTGALRQGASYKYGQGVIARAATYAGVLGA